MVSEINKAIPPVGLFACGVSISGGQSNPVLIGGEEKNPVSDEISNFSMQSSDDTPNYHDGFPSKFSTFGGYTTSAGITSISYTKSTFKSKVNGVAGTYTFMSYEDSGTKWAVTNPDSSVVSDITLSQYGITISGTPVAGEGFIASYTQNPNTASDYSVVTTQIIRTTIWIDNVAKKFLLGDFNMLGHLGTLERYRTQMGAVRTFSQSFSTMIGGYPKGAQLEYLIPPNTADNDGERYKLRKVVSLVDDNTYDFTVNGVDNEHWMYCDVFDPDVNPFMTTTNLDGAKKICVFGILEDDFRVTDYKSVSYTLTQDCFVYGNISFISRRSGSYATITATKDGKTSTFIDCGIQIATYGVTGQIYIGDSILGTINNSGKIVRKGTTITVKYSMAKCKWLYGGVIAFPASVDRLERI